MSGKVLGLSRYKMRRFGRAYRRGGLYAMEQAGGLHRSRATSPVRANESSQNRLPSLSASQPEPIGHLGCQRVLASSLERSTARLAAHQALVEKVNKGGSA